jgi:hypothetical protein
VRGLPHVVRQQVDDAITHSSDSITLSMSELAARSGISIPDLTYIHLRGVISLPGAVSAASDTLADVPVAALVADHIVAVLQDDRVLTPLPTLAELWEIEQRQIEAVAESVHAKLVHRAGVPCMLAVDAAKLVAEA